MMEQRNKLILRLVDMFSKKKVSSQVIVNAMELICNAYDFDYAMVYEIDQLECFNLKEIFPFSVVNPRESIALEELDFDFQDKLKGEEMCCLSGSTSFEKDMLAGFDASFCACYGIVDEDMNIDGFILMANTQKRQKDLEDVKGLFIVSSMLARYIGARTYQSKVAFAKVTLDTILNNTGVDIYINDYETHEVIYMNQSMAKPYGGISKVLGRKCWEALFPEQDGPCDFCPKSKITDEDGNPTKVYSWDYQRPFDGSWFRVFSSAFRWIDGRIAHIVSSADITENKKNEEIIKHMANYDSLTNLPNRRMLIKECSHRIDNAESGGHGYLLFFDIDGFKTKINDRLGHDAGDEFLIELGAFFTSIPLLKGSIYRNGGDEFIAIIDGANAVDDDIRELAHHIHQRFKEPWILRNVPAYCDISIGVAKYPIDGKTAEKLLYAADQAMYRVKKNGGGDICFAHETNN